MADLTRRQAGKLFFATTVAAGAGVPASFLATAHQARAADWRHGLSLFGSLKYPADFANFDYVNPGAPKGGRMRHATIGTFD
ncbi:MAG: ABC transporter substrate-binding protein, partial [Pseudomonadota bacterium]